MQYPTLHKPVPMGTKVRLPETWLSQAMTGEVVGISAIHVIFMYIILLDEPVKTEFGVQRACVCGGSQLDGLDGSHWRFVDLEDQLNYYKQIGGM